MPRPRPGPQLSGFTLVELVVVIVLVGILAVVGANIIGNFVSGYTSSAERSELAGVGRVAIERMTRELRRAVPNSVRILDSGRQITFLRMDGGGRYVAVGTSASRMELGETGDAFVAFGLSGLAADRQLAVYPLTAEELYQDLATSSSGVRARIDDAGGNVGHDARTVKLDSGDGFALDSPQRRLLSVDAMVSFCRPLGDDRLRMAIERPLGADPNPTVSTSCDDSHPPLAGPVTDVTFTYTEGTLARSGLVRIYLELTSPASGESIDFQQEVHVRNVP